MPFKNPLMNRTDSFSVGGTDDLPPSKHQYRLPGGRTVYLEECHIGLSWLGFLAGTETAIRNEVVRQLPERVRAQFPGNYGVVIKPVPEGELPAYTFMVALTCNHPVSDPDADCSSLILCWLGDDIETSLPEMISREIRAVEWDEHAKDANF